MYTQRQIIHPALGKEAEVRALLTDRIRNAQSKRDVALLTRLFSSEGPALVVATRVPNLETLDSHRKENLADSDFQAFAARLSTLLSGPVLSHITEVLIPMSGSGAPGVVQRAVGFPAPGKERQVRSICEEFVKARQGLGIRASLGTRIFSATGSAIEVTTVYADLAALDKVRKEHSQLARDASQAVSELSRAPIQQRLFEPLVPFKSS